MQTENVSSLNLRKTEEGLFFYMEQYCDLLLIGMTHIYSTVREISLKKNYLLNHSKNIVKLPVVIHEQFKLIILGDASVASHSFYSTHC